MNEELRIRARTDDFHDHILLSIYKIAEPGHIVTIMKTDSFEKLNDAHLYSTVPHVAIEMKEAQALVDQLWECGLRPTEGAGSAGAMAATKAHIADLQAMNDRLYNLVQMSVPHER